MKPWTHGLGFCATPTTGSSTLHTAAEFSPAAQILLNSVASCTSLPMLYDHLTPAGSAGASPN